MTSEQYLNLNRNVLLSATAAERAVMMVVGLVSGCLSGFGAKLRNISAACACVVLALGIVCVVGLVVGRRGFGDDRRSVGLQIFVPGRRALNNGSDTFRVNRLEQSMQADLRQ
jgi:hypothetical protein